MLYLQSCNVDATATPNYGHRRHHRTSFQNIRQTMNINKFVSGTRNLVGSGEGIQGLSLSGRQYEKLHSNSVLNYHWFIIISMDNWSSECDRTYGFLVLEWI